MLFYVNSFDGETLGLPSVYPNNRVGLFTKCESKGKGNFCGYYAVEYYLDTTLYAHYDAKGSHYAPEKRISDVRVCNIPCEKIMIGSAMWTLVIEADTVEEAIEKFKNAQWRHHRYSDYGITVEQLLDKFDFDEYKHVMVTIKDGETTNIYIDEDIEFIPQDILSRIIKEGPTEKHEKRNITIELMI